MGKVTQCGRELEGAGGGGGGAAQQSVLRGGSNPYPFLYHVYLLLTNGTPFAYRVKNATFL